MYRVLPAINEPLTYAIHNKFALHHLYNVSGYEAVGVQYYNDYLEQMALGTPLVDLLNIKYVILPKGATLDGKPVKVGDVIQPFKVVMNSDALLLENLNALPRAYPVHNAYLAESCDEILAMMQHQNFNPREFVILEERPSFEMAQENVPSAESQVEITEYKTRKISLNATMATDGFVVLSEKYYPGWNAFVDGKKAKIYQANYTLQALALPKGAHEIALRFQPAQARFGLMTTVATLIGLACFFAAPSHLRRKR